MSRRDPTSSDDDLLAAFVAAFARLDDLTSYDAEIPSEMLTGATAEWTSEAVWRPIAVQTPREKLDELYKELSPAGSFPIRFPALFERLLLEYRWLRVDLGECRLLGNAPAEDFAPFLQEIRFDRYLFAALLPRGYLQFAYGPGVDYDAFCFDMNRRAASGECPIVRISHEQILCFDRVRVTAQAYSGFRELVSRILAKVGGSEEKPGA